MMDKTWNTQKESKSQKWNKLWMWPKLKVSWNCYLKKLFEIYNKLSIQVDLQIDVIT